MKRIILSTVLVVGLGLTSFAQIGIGTASPDPSSVLDVSSVTKGVLPPRMTDNQIDAIVSAAEGLMVYCTDCIPKGLYVYDGATFLSLSLGIEIQTTGTDTGTTVLDVTGNNGGVWMDRNLGAIQAATSSSDVDSYGDLYQWGRVKDGHESRSSAVISTTATSGNPGHGDFITAGSGTDNNWTDFAVAGENALWQSGLNDSCPSGYRVPTDAELNGERATFPTQNLAGAYNSPLKLPASGYRNLADGAVTNVGGSHGYYWSSTVSSSGANARYLLFHSGDVNMYDNSRAHGFSVRCIKN